MHCYHSCFYYCEFTFTLLLSSCLSWKIYCDDHSSLPLTFNGNFSILNHCKFTLVILAFSLFISFLILSCAFGHLWNLRIINVLLLLLSFNRVSPN